MRGLSKYQRTPNIDTIFKLLRLLNSTSRLYLLPEFAMARHEADKEDLIRDAVALRNRIEWDVPCEPEAVVTGLRSDQSLSVFFGQDPVYHFNPDGQLRRAYVDGFLYRTQGETLAKMHRERTETETVLVRVDLDEESLGDFLSSMRARIKQLRRALAEKVASCLRSVTDSDATVNFPDALANVETAVPPLAPAIASRRK